MLRVARLTDQTGRYYVCALEGDPGVAVFGASTDDGVGRWRGEGAGRLGLAGPVDGTELANLLGGRRPQTGAPLRGRPTRTSGFDLTFAPPKSLSVLAALGGAETGRTLVAAHEEAVAQALRYVADRALAVARTDGERRRPVPVRAMIAASFPHALSRSLDPHLHTHVVVPNLGQCEKGRWSALDARGLYAHARAAGALYDAHLRHVVGERLGLAWSLRHSGAMDLAGIDPAVVGAFSSRQAEIRAHLGAGVPTPWTRPPTPRARAVAWALTREPRRAAPPADELRARWHATASAAGLLPGPGALVHRARGAARPRALVDEHRFAAALHHAARTGATRRQVVAAWAGSLESGAPAQAVEACVEQLARWPHDVGVAERSQPLSVVVPAPHLVEALGPRPASPGALGEWRRGAEVLSRYAARWPELRDAERLGRRAAPAELSSMPADRLAAHLQAVGIADEVRRRLGHTVALDADRELSLALSARAR